MILFIGSFPALKRLRVQVRLIPPPRTTSGSVLPVVVDLELR